MTERNLRPTWDGDQPLYRVRFRDGEGWRNFASAAVVFRIQDEDGNAIATRPGLPVSPKSDGWAYCMMKGNETDWAGIGKQLYVIPMVYYAEAPDRTPAVNLLLNPSFDTYTGGTGIADSWTQGGTLADMIYEVRQDDPAPPVIFGKCQRSYAPIGGSTTAFISQSPVISLVPGDFMSGGVWYRAKVDTGGSVTGTEHYLTVHSGAEAKKIGFPASDTDWTFIVGEAPIATEAATSGLSLVNLSAKGYEIRYDEAFLFKGRWASFPGEVFRLVVQRRPRPSKTNFVNENFIAGSGGFDEDSNSDGVGDGWSKTGATNTYSIERDPDHLNISIFPLGSGAQKVVVAASTTDFLRLIYRGNLLPTEKWRFQLYYKNSGALSGSPANGDFGLILHTEEFDGIYEASLLTGANFSLSSVSAYTAKFRELTLTAAHSALVLDINLKTATGGTIWLDDALLWRTA